jgi:hypothetical protein
MSYDNLLSVIGPRHRDQGTLVRVRRWPYAKTTESSSVGQDHRHWVGGFTAFTGLNKEW